MVHSTIDEIPFFYFGLVLSSHYISGNSRFNKLNKEISQNIDTILMSGSDDHAKNHFIDTILMFCLTFIDSILRLLQTTQDILSAPKLFNLFPLKVQKFMVKGIDKLLINIAEVLSANVDKGYRTFPDTILTGYGHHFNVFLTRF